MNTKGCGHVRLRCPCPSYCPGMPVPIYMCVHGILIYVYLYICKYMYPNPHMCVHVYEHIYTCGYNRVFRQVLTCLNFCKNHESQNKGRRKAANIRGGNMGRYFDGCTSKVRSFRMFRAWCRCQ